MPRWLYVRTLHHNAQTVCSNDDLLQEEYNHLKTVLKLNDYPEWAIHKGSQIKKYPNDGQGREKTKEKKEFKVNINSKLISTTQMNVILQEFKGFVVIPYVKRLSEPYKREMEKVAIQVFFKGATS